MEGKRGKYRRQHARWDCILKQCLLEVKKALVILSKLKEKTDTKVDEVNGKRDRILKELFEHRQLSEYVQGVANVVETATLIQQTAKFACTTLVNAALEEIGAEVDKLISVAESVHATSFALQLRGHRDRGRADFTPAIKGETTDRRLTVCALTLSQVPKDNTTVYSGQVYHTQSINLWINTISTEI